MVELIVISRNGRVEMYEPMGYKAKEILTKIMEKYGIKGELEHIWCG